MKITLALMCVAMVANASTSAMVLDGAPDGVSIWFTFAQAALALAAFVAAVKTPAGK